LIGLKIQSIDSVQSLENQLKNAILDEVYAYFNTAIYKAAPIIQEKIRVLFNGRIFNSELWEALQGQWLMGEVGLPFNDYYSRLKQITDIWISQIICTASVKKTNKDVRGIFFVKMLDTDWTAVCSDAAAHIITDKGQDLPWLEWLLKRGSEPIILGYKVIANPYGRSKIAVMRKEEGTNWHVSQFAGTEDNNEITKLLENIINDDATIMTIIESSLSE